MRWRSGRRSGNIEDRRGTRLAGRGLKGGGLGAIVITLAALYFGVDPALLFDLVETGTGPRTETVAIDPAQAELADFVSVVLADTEDTWHALFEASGGEYQAPTLVLFSGAVQSACGRGEAAMGPFYCPADRKIYIDLSFYHDLKTRHGASGDFAEAYVIAHEVGHHVQTLLGISARVQAARQRLNSNAANQLSVRQELQADCFAGLWAHHADRTRHVIEPGDIEEALNAASSIGDDRLQKQSRGYVTPESFTHGSSAQRVRWFKRGWESGDLQQCDSFEAASL